MESDLSTVVRQPYYPTTLPARGEFTFPAPYNTKGIRLTSAADCAGGTDCVDYIGYSYWRNINNAGPSDTMLMFVTLDKNRGGAGPSLFTYNKSTGVVTNAGPLFADADLRSWDTGEGWFFSALHQNTLFITQDSRVRTVDVSTRQVDTVFDIAGRFPNSWVKGVHTNTTESRFSAVIVDTTTWQPTACAVFDQPYKLLSTLPIKVDPGLHQFGPNGPFDECQLDTSGRWLLIKENVDNLNGEDNVIVDLLTGTQKLLLDEAGAAGHSDNGFGYMVANDNWNQFPGAARLWAFDQPFPSAQPGTPPQGLLVYRSTDWNVDIGHISHTNAQLGIPASHQYVCGGNANRLILPHNNEVLCFKLDGSLQVLVVAPMMTNLDAPGGGADDYAKQPKGNLDPSGQYFIWTSNLGGNRLDAFMVQVPAQLLK